MGAALSTGLRVAVLGGGTSDEREVSLRTQDEVERALRVGQPALEVLSVEILPDGRWRFGAQEASPARALESLDPIDVFFLALHGGPGENGALQGFLESAGQAFTGSGVAASALCMDKELQRIFLSARGVDIAPGRTFDRRAWASERAGLERELLGLAPDCWVVKPRRNGSSVGVRIARGAAELASAIEHALEFDDDVLVEAQVVGTEATCGVLGNHGDELRALTPVEIRPHEGRFFDYEEKYSEGGALELCPPRSLSVEVQGRLREQALRAHRELGCDGYSRSDFIVRPDGVPVFLETNTLPGLTSRSLLPQEAAHDGIEFSDLCRRLVGLGLAAARARDAQNPSKSSSKTSTE